MQRRRHLRWLSTLLAAFILLNPIPIRAGPLTQGDPATQCAEGEQLFLAGRATEAAPLLEAGFAERRAAKFVTPDDLGRCALVLGMVRYHAGNRADALAAYAVALDVFLASGNRVFEGNTLYNIGAVYIAQGRYTEALVTLRQALAIRREVGDFSSEGTVLNDIGAVYGHQGRFTEALDTHQQALAIAREVKDLSSEGTSLNNIGAIYNYLGRYAEALDAFMQTLAIQRAVGDRASEGVILSNIGAVHRSQGRYTEALMYFQQALVIQRGVGNRAGEGMTLANIGGIYDSQGRYGEALTTFQQALAILRGVGNRPSEGTTLNNIGLVYDHQGRYTEALDAYHQALIIARELGNRVAESAGLANIGAVYDRQGHYAEALNFHQQALVIQRDVGGRADEGATLHNIGLVYDHQVGYYKALDSYKQALAIRREVGDRPGESMTLNGIGTVYAHQGRYAEALDAYKQALIIAREVGDRSSVGLMLENIGYTYYQLDQPEQALGYSEQAIQELEAVRVGGGSEMGRTGFIAQYAGLYSRAVGLYHELRREAEAFQTSERGHARAFLDSLATGYVELSDNAAADLLEQEQKTYAVRQTTQDALARARGAQPLDVALIADLGAQLAAAEKEHAASLAAIQAREDQLAALVPGRGGVLELSEVQTLLDEQTTLVSYHVLEDEGSLAFVINKDDFEVVELPDATPERLRTTITDLNQWLQDNPENPHPLRLRNLYTWLVAPLADHLHTPRVGVIPHQLLHYVPFAALTDGETYFGRRYALFTLPSVSALRFIQANAAKAPGASAIVFGNPKTEDPNLKPLGYAEAEAKSVASLLHASAAIGAEASEARLREGAAGAGVVHLAAHGSYNVANSLYSAIFLVPGGQGTGGDGRLETHEVYGLDLKAADLVVLSACQTNIGELSAGDELVGLTRAFFFAGTPTIISSLWSVDDAATGALMTAFYRHWLQDGMSKAQALQTAQADVRSDPRWASPFFWAGFVLNGDPGKLGQGEVFGKVSVLGVRLPVQNLAPYAIIAVVLLTAAIIVLLVRRRHH